MRKKRIPWPRWAKVIRNLLLVLFLGVFIWDLLEKPPATRPVRRPCGVWNGSISFRKRTAA